MTMEQRIQEVFAVANGGNPRDVAKLKIIEDPDTASAYVSVFFHPHLGRPEQETATAESVKVACRQLFTALIGKLFAEESTSQFAAEALYSFVYEQ